MNCGIRAPRFAYQSSLVMLAYILMLVTGSNSQAQSQLVGDKKTQITSPSNNADVGNSFAVEGKFSDKGNASISVTVIVQEVDSMDNPVSGPPKAENASTTAQGTDIIFAYNINLNYPSGTAKRLKITSYLTDDDFNTISGSANTVYVNVVISGGP